MLQQWMIQQYHDNSAQDYSEILKIMELFSRNYYFPKIKKEIECYINKYLDYQRNKYSIYAPYKYI